MADNIKLAGFDIDASAAVKGTAELKRSIDELKESQKEARAEGKTGTQTYIKNEAQLAALNKEYRTNIKALSGLTQEQRDNLSVTEVAITRDQQLASVLDQEATSVNEARKQNKELNKLRNETNVTTDKGRQELADLNAQIDNNNDFIKENTDGLTQQKMQVGDYAGGIKDALGELNPFNQSFSVFITNIQESGGLMPALSKGLSGVTAGIKGATRASLAFIATPIGAVIAAIAAVVGLMVVAFGSVQSEMDKVTAVTRPLTAILDSLFGVVQKLGSGLIAAFENPQQTLKDLANFVKNNLINRFTAFGEILEGIINLDFKQVTNGVLQAGTGVENLTDKVQNAAKETANFLSEAAEIGAELNRITIEYENIQTRNAVLLPKLQAELKEQNKIAEDLNKTTAEREQAAANSIALSEQINAAKREEINLELQIAENEASRNDTSREDELEIAKIKGKLYEADAAAAEQQTTQQNKLNTIRKQAISDQEKATAKAIAKQKELLDLYIAEQGIAARTMEEELAINEEVSERKKDILDDELEAKLISEEQYRIAVLDIDNQLAQDRAQIAIKNATDILDIQRSSLEARRANEGFLTAELAAQKQADNEAILAQEQALAEQKLENGLINQEEYNLAIRDLNEETRLANKEIDDERKEIEKEEQAELLQINFENELAKLEEEGASKYELRQAQIDQERSAELAANQRDFRENLISERIYQARAQRIRDAADRQEIANKKELANQTIALSANALGSVAQLLGENSKAGKAIAISQALINTYQGISAGVALGYPMAIPAVIAAAATGFASVANIASTKPEGESSSGGKSASSVQGNTMNADAQSLERNQSNASSVAASGNAAIQQQIRESSANDGLADTVGTAVRDGAREGTAAGSEEGITNLSDNKQVASDSSF